MTYTLVLCISVTWAGCGQNREISGYESLEECVQVLELSTRNKDTTGYCVPETKKAQPSD